MRLSLRIFACLSLAIATAGTGLALSPDRTITQYLHRIRQPVRGNQQAYIFALKQTHDHYLWLGTMEGVLRYDGDRFAPVPALQQAGLGDIWVRDMEEDDAGNIWMTTDDYRLVRVGPQGVKAFGEEDSLLATEFSCVFPGKPGEMWACTASGLVRFRAGRIEALPAPSPLTSRPVAGCQTSDGRVWIGGGSILESWDGSRFSPVSLRSVAGDLLIRSLVCVDDDLWIGTGQGLLRLRGQQETLYTTRDGLADNMILSLASGSDGTVWAGTRKGFSRIRKIGIESYGAAEGLSQNTVYALGEDLEGTLWVATKNGLDQFLDGSATRYTRNEGLASNNMGPVMVDHRGTVWAATLDGGVARFDGKRFRELTSLAPARIIALAETSDGAIWVGTDRGLRRVREDAQVERFGEESGLPAAEIRSLFRDQQGRLWVGTRRGAAVLQDGRFVTPPGLGKELAAPISAIGQTRDGMMLLSVEHGNLYAYQNQRIRRFEEYSQPAPRLPLQDVIAIFTDPEGVVWIGANGGGLGMWRNGKLSRWGVRDGLFDNEIFGFVEGEKDRLWMSCSNGFFWVNRADLFQSAAGKLPKITSTPYTPLEGTRSQLGTPGVHPAGGRTVDGRLWFSSTASLLAFAPDPTVGTVAPAPVLEQITVNGSDIVLEQPVKLAPDPDSVAFRYTAPTLVSPTRISFRYMLEGRDKNWTEAGSRREAFYTNLPPGKFRFRVAACGGNGPCREAASPLNMEVLPQFYQRVWFIPLCAGFLALMGLSIHRMQVRQIRAQFALVLAERSRIARELHDTLIQGFSGITMQMQAFSSRLRGAADRQALGEIIRDAGICLQETRRSVAGLRAGTGPKAGLAEAIADAARQLTQERDIKLKLNLDDGRQHLPAEVNYNLLCIAQEAITNVLKHAEANTVEVMLSCSPRELRLCVRDDGRGMNPVWNGTGGEIRADGGHYGLVGMRERASQIGAKIEVVSKPGQGTEIQLYMPVRGESPVNTTVETAEAV